MLYNCVNLSVSMASLFHDRLHENAIRSVGKFKEETTCGNVVNLHLYGKSIVVVAQIVTLSGKVNSKFNCLYST